jgi:putative phage-type endonuclease
MAPATKRKKPTKLAKPSVLSQGTEAWKLLRAGKVTASRIADVIKKIKVGESTGRRDYRIQLVTERLTGLPTDYGYESYDMRWGSDQEPFARIAYEDRRNLHVEQIAFAQHPTLEFAGASPDGLIGEDGLIEIKCPRSFTHINTILDDVVPEDYKPQMLWQMACTGRAWCDFVSYDPRMPEHLRLFIKRFHRDEAAIQTITEEVILFLGEVQELTEKLNNLHPKG